MIARALALELLQLQWESPDEPLEVFVQVPYDDEGNPLETFTVVRVEVEQVGKFRHVVLHSYD